MGERDAVLFANELFYRAFADADLAAMEDIWATGPDTISVVHPGTSPILGRDEVLETWQVIFEGASHVDIGIADTDARVYGDFAIVLFSEIVHGHGLSATNVFCRTPQGWRLVHHQAGPSAAARRQQEFDRPLMH